MNSNDSTLRISEFVLASLLTSYPDDGFVEDVKLVLDQEPDIVTTVLRQRVVDILQSEEKMDDLRSEYLALFDSGRGIAPLYETEYGRQRALFKANELAAISGFYHAFGFELGGEDSLREMADHVSVELEFYALLLMKQSSLENIGDTEGVEIVSSARKKFLRDHVGRFVPSILDRPGVSESETYGDILRFCDQLLRTECSDLGVSPEKATWIEGEQGEAEVTCGVEAGCAK
jgi:nitrate reductase assembly molybdenum cofactor insertion protein NarJ